MVVSINNIMKYVAFLVISFCILISNGQSKEQSEEEAIIATLNYKLIKKKYNLSKATTKILFSELKTTTNTDFDFDFLLDNPEFKYHDRDEPIVMSRLDIRYKNEDYIADFFPTYLDVGEIVMVYNKKISINEIKGFAAYINANLVVYKVFFDYDSSKYVYHINFLKGNNFDLKNYWFRSISETENLSDSLSKINIKDLESRYSLITFRSSFINKIIYENTLTKDYQPPATYIIPSTIRYFSDSVDAMEEQPEAGVTTPDDTQASSATATAPATTTPVQQQSSASQNNNTPTPEVAPPASTNTTLNISEDDANRVIETGPTDQEIEERNRKKELLLKQKASLKISLSDKELSFLSKEIVNSYIIEKDYIKFRTEAVVGLWHDIITGEIIEIRKIKGSDNEYGGYIKFPSQNLVYTTEINTLLDWFNNDLRMMFSLNTYKGAFIDNEKMINKGNFIIDPAKGLLIISLPNKETKYYAPLITNTFPELYNYIYSPLIESYKPVDQDNLTSYSNTLNDIKRPNSFIFYPALPIVVVIIILAIL